MKTRLNAAIIFGILMLTLLPGRYTAYAQNPSGPIVYAVLFFDPGCDSCQKVIDENLPPLQEKYGDQLQLLKVDTSQADGAQLYRNTVQHYNLTGPRLGVPTLVVGENVLVGSHEIPQQFPGIIEEGLTQGGIHWPDIPGLDAFIQKQASPSPVPTAQPTEAVTSVEQSSSNSIWQKFANNYKRDPTANAIAVVVLIVMVVSVLIILSMMIRGALSESSLTNSKNRSNPWIIPVFVILGLIVAGYLTYVEVGERPAVCGPVGHCNEVQQSKYAKLFGIFPVGVVGMAGYGAIMIAWAIGQFGPVKLREWSKLALWGMALFGVLFSIYLTFLEPFVIGASCAWCLTSAVLMTILLWVSVDPARDALAADSEG